MNKIIATLAVIALVFCFCFVTCNTWSPIKAYVKYLNVYYQVKYTTPKTGPVYDELVGFLKKYEAWNNGVPVKLIRCGSKNDGGYVVPEIALQKADVLFGYGIGDNIEFEEEFSEKYGKESFGFDCGVPYIKTNNEKCHFIRECIGNDKFLFSEQQNSGRISTYSEQLKKRNFENKKVFIKMDIEGAEFDVFDDILKHKNNITGIVLEIHCFNPYLEEKALRLLRKISEDFVLLHVHSNNFHTEYFTAKNVKGKISLVFELTYINKNIVDTYKMSVSQKCPTSLDAPCRADFPECGFEIF